MSLSSVSLSAASAMTAETPFLIVGALHTQVVRADSVCLVLSFGVTGVLLPLPEKRTSRLAAQDRHAQSQGVTSGGFQTR